VRAGGETVRKLIVVVAALVLVGVVPAHARTNCCFEMAADAEQSAKVDYGNDASTFYNGSYELQRFWSIRSIVGFHETFFRHRPVFQDKATEGRLITSESEQITQKTARKDASGNPIRDPLKCKPGDAFQGGSSEPAPIKGGVGLVKGSSGYRLRLDAGRLFNSESPLCPGGADFSLHKKLHADSAGFQVVPPPKSFLRSAHAGAHKSNTFQFGPYSVTHGNVAGLHTFTGGATLTVKFSWFPRSELRAERKRLKDIKCPPDLKCDADHWGE
jgi:hypothetical protein